MNFSEIKKLMNELNWWVPTILKSSTSGFFMTVSRNTSNNLEAETNADNPAVYMDRLVAY